MIQVNSRKFKKMQSKDPVLIVERSQRLRTHCNEYSQVKLFGQKGIWGTHFSFHEQIGFLQMLEAIMVKDKCGGTGR